jgi:hypothetical protein
MQEGVVFAGSGDVFLLCLVAHGAAMLATL